MLTLERALPSITPTVFYIFFPATRMKSATFRGCGQGVKVELFEALDMLFTFLGTAVKSPLILALTSQTAQKSERQHSALASKRHQQVGICVTRIQL